MILLSACDAFLLVPCPESEAEPERVWSSVSAGFDHVCAVDGDGEVVCSTLNDGPPSGTLIALTSGYSFTCALDADGLPICWGDPQLYWQEVIDQAPDQILDQIDAGDNHVCGLHDGAVTCWGRTEQISYDLLTPPADLTDVTQVSAGYSHTCALDQDGALTCWGEDGTWTPDDAAGPYLNVVAGKHLTCAQRADDLRLSCWGDDPPDTSSLDGQDFSALRAGLLGVCGLNEAGFTCALLPDTELPTGPLLDLDLSLNGAFGCALDPDGLLSCFGEHIPDDLPE